MHAWSRAASFMHDEVVTTVVASAQYAFFLNTNPTLLVDKTGIIKVSGNGD